MAGRWRVFIGMWDDGAPEWAHHDEVYDEWIAAQAYLLHRLGRFHNDDCEPCRKQAAEEARRLLETVAGYEFVGEVEGDDYLLIRSDRTSLSGIEP